MWLCLLHGGKRKGHGRLGALLSLTQQNTFTASTQGDERLWGWGCPRQQGHALTLRLRLGSCITHSAKVGM